MLRTEPLLSDFWYFTEPRFGGVFCCNTLAQDVPLLGFGVAGRTAIALASALQYRGDHIS